MLQRTLAPSFFYLLSSSSSFYLPFLYLAYLHMIDQSKMPLLLLLLLLLLLWCARVGVGGCRQVRAVCGMNFQNFFQRIESLHQRTLIRILYEFFFPVWLQNQRDQNMERARGSLRREDIHEFRVGRIKHERVKVPRGDQLLEWAMQVMKVHADRKAILEVEFKDEEGTGLGPTLEFFALVAAELQREYSEF